jgi:hypothetical protein
MASAQVSSGLVGLAITYALRLTDTLNQVNPAGKSARLLSFGVDPF